VEFGEGGSSDSAGKSEPHNLRMFPFRLWVYEPKGTSILRLTRGWSLCLLFMRERDLILLLTGILNGGIRFLLPLGLCIVSLLFSRRNIIGKSQ
jgi:hypothetical protein